MADSIEEIDHSYFGSPGDTLNKTFLPIISSFSSFPFIKITLGQSIYLEEYKPDHFASTDFFVDIFRISVNPKLRKQTSEIKFETLVQFWIDA